MNAHEKHLIFISRKNLQGYFPIMVMTKTLINDYSLPDLNHLKN